MDYWHKDWKCPFYKYNEQRKVCGKDCEHARDLGFQFGSLAHESWFCIYNGPHTTGANYFCIHGQKREKGELEDDP